MASYQGIDNWEDEEASGLHKGSHFDIGEYTRECSK
jgi:hypothetical protein